MLLDVQDVSVRFGGIVALDGLTFVIKEGDICGLIGPNGAGKTTMFKLITGQLQPDSGSFEVGETVKLAYVDQEHNQLIAEK